MMRRRQFIEGLGAAGVLSAAGCAGVGRCASGRAYSVAVLGDTHFDTEPASVYHSHYRNEGKEEWLWKVQREEFARNGEMWRVRCRRMLAASAKVAHGQPTDFVLQLGDVIQGDCDDALTHKKMLGDCIRMLRAPYPKGLPFLTVVGNHDFRGIGAADAYFGFSESFLAKELGQPAKYPVFSFWHGPDLWVFCHFEQAKPQEIVRVIDGAGRTARHVFLVTHGPFTPGESVDWCWRLCGWGTEPAARAELLEALLRRRAVVLSGHTHQVAWWRIATAHGSYSEMTVNSVWATPELATAEPVAATPAAYGEATLAKLREAGKAADAQAYERDIAPFKDGLKAYFQNFGAGHFRLNVGETSVTMDYFPGDAETAARTFVLKD